MLFNEVISLINTVNGENAMGDTITTSTEKDVFADKKSVSQNEFYQAASTGLKPEVKFEIRTVEYNGEQKLSYNGKEYSIIRTFEKDNEFTELIASGTVSMGDPNVK